jgi:hypothetical protein
MHPEWSEYSNQPITSNAASVYNLKCYILYLSFYTQKKTVSEHTKKTAAAAKPKPISL